MPAATGSLAAQAGTAHAEAGQDTTTMLKQEKTQWRWVASGLHTDVKAARPNGARIGWTSGGAAT